MYIYIYIYTDTKDMKHLSSQNKGRKSIFLSSAVCIHFRVSEKVVNDCKVSSLAIYICTMVKIDGRYGLSGSHFSNKLKTYYQMRDTHFFPPNILTKLLFCHMCQDIGGRVLLLLDWSLFKQDLQKRTML